MEKKKKKKDEERKKKRDKENLGSEVGSFRSY